MEKLLPVEGLFKKLEQNGFHWPENKFALARSKDLLKNKFTLGGNKSFRYKECLKNKKKVFH